MLGCKFGGNLPVEGDKVGFELLQFVLRAPLFRDDDFELGNICFQIGGSFLVLGDDAGFLLQSVNEVGAL